MSTGVSVVINEDARTLYLFLNQVEWRPEDVGPAGIPADCARFVS
jgi:hypothetical protein